METFLQDEPALCHTSLARKRFLEGEDVQLFEDWPEQSFDLNKLRLLLWELKKHVSKRFGITAKNNGENRQ